MRNLMSTALIAVALASSAAVLSNSPAEAKHWQNGAGSNQFLSGNNGTPAWSGNGFRDSNEFRKKLSKYRRHHKRHHQQQLNNYGNFANTGNWGNNNCNVGNNPFQNGGFGNSANFPYGNPYYSGGNGYFNDNGFGGGNGFFSGTNGNGYFVGNKNGHVPRGNAYGYWKKRGGPSIF